ncbi:hypothetical protein IscW_ISCW024848 [Ixodes scapularis]|uniref:Uncharacterized protein n=1 Tax=Ixodes scapularis TaxID=6945 RepID=B7QM48_IXOSC|nr:hypothetical protein IscW_ISCW024848 [Ixodes scapularis]|eukprot:XP_002416253.1 hypothetical protein IscW_ISCW024848 [Ixodes scapularis]
MNVEIDACGLPCPCCATGSLSCSSSDDDKMCRGGFLFLFCDPSSSVARSDVSSAFFSLRLASSYVAEGRKLNTVAYGKVTSRCEPMSTS